MKGSHGLGLLYAHSLTVDRSPNDFLIWADCVSSGVEGCEGTEQAYGRSVDGPHKLWSEDSLTGHIHDLDECTLV